MDYRDLDKKLVVSVVEKEFEKVIDILIAGSYAYGNANKESDLEIIVVTSRPIKNFEGKKVKKWIEGTKWWMVERGKDYAYDHLWLGKYKMPFYSVKFGKEYPGDSKHIEKWKNIKKERNCGKNT